MAPPSAAGQTSGPVPTGRNGPSGEVEVETPVRLSARQRELLEEFQMLEGSENNCPKTSGFFAKLKNAWDELTE